MRGREPPREGNEVWCDSSWEKPAGQLIGSFFGECGLLFGKATFGAHFAEKACLADLDEAGEIDQEKHGAEPVHQAGRRLVTACMGRLDEGRFVAHLSAKPRLH